MSIQTDVTLTLSGDAALVLDAALAGLTTLPIRLDRPAELAALWELEAALERCLVVTFAPDYDEALDAARQRLVEQAGINSDAASGLNFIGNWTCCFCAEASSETDPASVQLQLPEDDGAVQLLRAHPRCLTGHLHTGVPILARP